MKATLSTSLHVHSCPLLLLSVHFAITFTVTSNIQSRSKTSAYFSFDFTKGDYVGFNFLQNYDFSLCTQLNIPNGLHHQLVSLHTYILRRTTKKHPTHHNITKLQEHEEALQKEIRSAKLNYESALLDDHATTVNHNKIFRYVSKKSD